MQTATEMATVCAGRFAADIGIGVTGTMGNVDPANPDASVPGDVYFAIRFGNDIYTHYLKLPCELTRLEYKLTVAESICDELMMLITSR